MHELAPLAMLQTLDISMNDVSQLPPQLSLLPVLQNLTIIGNPIRSIQSVQQLARESGARPPQADARRRRWNTASGRTVLSHSSL